MNKEEYEQRKHNRNHTSHKISEAIYPFMLDIIEKYQANYTGKDKMTREYMLKEIERFRK